jgi:hypothetical protein
MSITFTHTQGMVDLMVDSAQPLLMSWEERVDRNGGITDIKIDDDIRAYSADVISRTCFGSSYIKGKEIFMKIRELQQAVSKPNVLAEMTGLRLGGKRNTRVSSAYLIVNKQNERTITDPRQHID